MPDFRGYQDPGVYIEALPVPLIVSPSISGTVIGLVGDTQRFRTASESVRLVSSASTQLLKTGIDVTTIVVKNRFTGATYSSSVIGRLNTAVGSSDTTISVIESGTPPTTPFDIIVDSERMTVTNRTNSSGNIWTYTVTRGVGGSTAAAHLSGAVVNTATAGDYTVSVQGGVDGLIGGPDDLTSIGITPSGSSIASGDYVNVSYRYTDTTYYDITPYRDYASLRDAYGEPFDSSGLINSELSLGAYLAFANGADVVYAVPVQASGSVPSDAEFQTAIDALLTEDDVNVVVPLTGSTTVINYVKTHCEVSALSQDIYRRAFVGLDGTAANVTVSTIISRAETLASERVSLVAPAVIEFDWGGNEPARIGGQYLAAAVAGRQASLPAQEPLTRKTIIGLSGIPDQALKSDILDMQQSGVLVVYQRRDGVMYVKHGLTTKTARKAPINGNLYTQEVSIVTARDRLRELIRRELDNSGVIGSAIDDMTPDIVLGVVTGALETSKQTGLINDYANLSYVFPSGSPTTMDISFVYKPTLPLNYIQVRFAFDTTTGQVQFEE